MQDAPDQALSLPPLSAFVEITQRPLFNDTRRPALAADLPGDAWSSFVLKGVIVSPITRELSSRATSPRRIWIKAAIFAFNQT